MIFTQCLCNRCEYINPDEWEVSGMKEYTAPMAEVIDFATDYVYAYSSPSPVSPGGVLAE